MKSGNNLYREYPLLILLLLLLTLPAAYGGYIDPTHISKFKLTIAFIQSLAFAIPLTLLSAKLGKVTKWIVISFVSLLFLCEAFCIFSIGSRLNPMAVSLFLQTNASEAGGFLAQTQQIKALGLSLLSLAVVLGIYFLLAGIKKRKAHKELSTRMSTAIAIVAAVLMLFSCSTIYLSTSTSLLPITPEEFGNNTAIQIAKSVSRVVKSQPDIDKIVKANQSITIDSIVGLQPTIVYIIGESYNRNHSPLYGYPHPTTLHLSTAKANGNLIVFDDIVCRHQTTKSMMKELMSTSTLSSDDIDAWSDSPLLPAVMKKAGYNVLMFDNQTSQTLSETFNEFSSSYFYTNAATSAQCFNFMNESIFPFDGEMVEYSSAVIEAQPADKPLFVIYHLNGQHAPAKKYYPDSFNIFTANDYSEKDFLSTAEKTTLAEYDNATLYNDHVINQIHDIFSNRPAIIIYTSDHGEEIYDFRNHYGRSDHPITADIAKCVFEVPAVIWLTTGYINECDPQTITSIRNSTSRKGINGHLPHLILDLSGVRTQSFVPEASIINLRYVTPKRILKGYCDYDTLGIH